MRRSSVFWRFACTIALAGSLTVPAQALAHGEVHEHLAEHRVAWPLGDAHDIARNAHLAPLGHGHEHSHTIVNAMPGQRDLVRVSADHESAVVLPASATDLVRHEVVAPARTELILLARPGPEGGPPPQLRAPPRS